MATTVVPLHQQPRRMVSSDDLKNTTNAHNHRTALLIVDVQPEYWSQCPQVRQDFPQFPENMRKLLEHCRNSNRADDATTILWVRADYTFEKGMIK